MTLGTYPMNMKRKQDVVIRAPRLDGDNIPNMATTGDTHTHTFILCTDVYALNTIKKISS
jgi:hypothetical protein